MTRSHEFLREVSPLYLQIAQLLPYEHKGHALLPSRDSGPSPVRGPVHALKAGLRWRRERTFLQCAAERFNRQLWGKPCRRYDGELNAQGASPSATAHMNNICVTEVELVG